MSICRIQYISYVTVIIDGDITTLKQLCYDILSFCIGREKDVIPKYNPTHLPWQAWMATNSR